MITRSSVVVLVLSCGAGEAASADDLEELKREVAELRRELAILREESEDDTETYQGAPLYGFGTVMNPDLSVVVNLQTTLSDSSNYANRNRIRVGEVEVALEGYIYPGIRTDVIVCFEQDYERDGGSTSATTETDLEEAYVTVTNLPWGIDRYLALQGGRKLLDFGRLNGVHPHHRAFPDNPLPLEYFLGSHNWLDDGVQADVLVPNPFEDYDLYLRWTSGLWNGRELHMHGHGHAGFGTTLLPLRGLLFQQRLYGDFPITQDMDLSVGGTYFWDEYTSVDLWGIDAGYHYQWPLSYRRTTLAGEFLWARVREFRTTSVGFFTYLNQTVTKYISAGIRYDWSEYPDNDAVHDWLLTPYLTYWLNESTYLRASYRYRERERVTDDSAVFLQFVWGLGPHSHRMSD